MSDKELPTFIFTLDKSIPDELNPNEDENIQFSFSNFSSHFDEHINKSITPPGCDVSSPPVLH